MSLGMLALKLSITGMGATFLILGLLGLMMHCFRYAFNTGKQAVAGTTSGLSRAPPRRGRKRKKNWLLSSLQRPITPGSSISGRFWLKP